MQTTYGDTIDKGTYPADTLWVAMIVKDRLKAPDNRVNYIATTKASTQAIAVTNIAKMQWPDHYWVEGKSTTRTLMVYRADNERIMATSTEPRKRKRRR